MARPSEEPFLHIVPAAEPSSCSDCHADAGELRCTWAASMACVSSGSMTAQECAWVRGMRMQE